MNWKVAYLLTLAVVFAISLVENHRHVPAVRQLSILLGVALLADGAGYLLRLRGINNQFIFYLYLPIEFAFLSRLYLANYTRPFLITLTRIVAGAFVLFSLFYLVWSWRAHALSVDPTLLYILQAFLLLLMVLGYFYDLYQQDALIVLTQQPVFWISLGNFLYYSGTFFVMGLVEELKRLNYAQAEQVFVINSVLNIVLYLLWAVGFLCLRKAVRNLFS
jgi:hypothetical protein